MWKSIKTPQQGLVQGVGLRMSLPCDIFSIFRTSYVSHQMAIWACVPLVPISWNFTTSTVATVVYA